MFIADYHTHSAHSYDGEGSMQGLLERALSVGLSEIAVTDHCDMGASFDMEGYVGAYNEVGSKNGRLLLGLELGEATHDLGRAEEAVKSAPFDFVLGSYHCLKGKRDFYYLEYNSPEECRELISAYLDETLELVSWGGFDCLGHLTYPLRYMNGRGGMSMSFAPFEDKLKAIFTLMAEKGIALELNVSGLYKGWGRTMPGPEELRLYRACGGETVTCGSDAHRPEHVGMGLAQGYDLLRQAGFDYVTAFSERRPRYEKL